MPPTRFSLDQGWRFHPGDIPFPVIQGHDITYASAKAGRAWGAAAPDYDDSEWRTLDLLHDWAVENPFDPAANLSQGYRPRGIAWYRRHFALPETDLGKHLEIKFDAIATHATVWLNGTLVHRNWCGYTSFSIDLTPLARFGSALNTIAIRVDADAQEGWWYEGAGIYRHTWLIKRNAVHITTDGLHANPIRTDAAANRWQIPAEITLANSGSTPAPVTIHLSLHASDGQLLAQQHTTATIPVLSEITARLTLDIANPRLWSVDTPALHTIRAEISRDDETLDTYSQTCGFRTLRFDPDTGFHLNDRPLKLQGACNHQDHAGVGVAVPDALWDFRIRRLKEMGVNACRCSHNPPAMEFLDACDRLGMLVMDENRHFNTTPEYIRQLEWLVRRDRNHPSVIMWSVFNEEPMQGTAQGYEMVRRMTAAVKRLDTTRPVTAAMNGGFFSPVNVSQAVDVVGLNYQIESYDRFRAANPRLRITSSEDTSAFMTRGEYFTDPARHIAACDDTQHAPWGATHRDAWRAIATRPWLAGGFVWTGFDYRGEPTPHAWPSAGSFFGAMDLCGFPKTAYYIHQAHWIKTRPILHIAPHWNWPGRENQPIRVLVISNAATIALTLDNRPLGEKTNDPFHFATWEVPYAPGRLEAIAKNPAGAEIARAAVETTGAPVALRLTPDRPCLLSTPADALPVTIEALDAQGRPVPTAANEITLTLAGHAKILGHGNGNPNSHEPEQGPVRALFNGLAQVILQSQTQGSAPQSPSCSPAPIVLRADAPGLASATLAIPLQAADASPAIPAAEQILALANWRMSPVSPMRPDPNLPISASDQNTWQQVQAGELQTHIGGRYAIYRATFTPFARHRAVGARIHFSTITGRAEIHLDGLLAATQPTPDPAPLTIPLPPAPGERTLSILIETAEHTQAGLGQTVIIK